MECPIRFNLWGTIVAEQRERALSIIRDQNVFTSEIELRKAVSSAIRDTSQIQISSALGYEKVTEFSKKVDGIFMALTFCQEGGQPSAGSSFCSKHNFHFGGCLGCHICNDFYAK